MTERLWMLSLTLLLGYRTFEHLWVCPLKISFRMVFIFNVAPILGVRCKQNVDERNPSLSLLSCLCRVMRPLHNLSTWKQSNAGMASVRLIKINSWFNTAPFKALQPCNSLARAIKLTWILLASCDSNGKCYKKNLVFPACSNERTVQDWFVHRLLLWTGSFS